MSDQTIQIPPTTSTTIVFPLNEESLTYKPENEVSSEEISQFLPKIETKVQQLVQNPHKYTVTKIIILGAIFSILWYKISSVAIDFITTHWNLTRIDAQSFFDPLRFSGYILVAKFCWGKLLWYSHVAPSLRKCQEMVDERNELLRTRGLKWCLPDQFPAWIELTKDLKKGADNALQNGPEKITFLMDRGRYSKDFYSPEMTDDLVSHKEMYEFLSLVNKALTQPFEIPLNKIWLIIVCEKLGYCGLLVVKRYFPDLFTPLANLVIEILILVFELSVFYFSCICKFSDKKRNRTECQKIIDRENQGLRSRGLRWHLPQEFPRLLELCKDYKNSSINGEPVLEKEVVKNIDQHELKNSKDVLLPPKDKNV